MQPLRPTQARDRVFRLVKTDLADALRTAREIDPPWYRAQALATVAAATPDARERRRLAEESFRVAEEQEEPNRVATVSSWPLAVLARDLPAEQIEAHVDRLAGLLDREPNPVRRCDALFMVAYHLRDVAPRPFLHAARRCAQAAKGGHGWKRDRNLKDLVLMLWCRGQRELAEALREDIEDARVKRQATRGMTEKDFGCYEGEGKPG